MDPRIKSALTTLTFAVLYLILFVALLPALLKILDQRPGRVLYGVLVGGAVVLALRLRTVSRRL
jgi:hypothetical protein